jgi:hypothetical protein
MDKVRSPKGRMIIDMMKWPDTGALTVLGFAPKDEQTKKDTIWKCRCLCGNIINVEGRLIRYKDKVSCGKCEFSNPRDKETGRMESVNKKVYNSKIEGLAPIERKIFNATPIAAPWSTSEVIAELARNDMKINPRTAAATLGTLSGKKLIIEGPRGWWKRVVVDPVNKNQDNPVENKPTQEDMATKPAEKTVKAENIEKRTPIEIVEELLDDLKAVMDKAESAALEISQYISGVEEDAKKLEQLKALLKGIGA